MAFTDWHEAVKHLKAVAQSATPKQQGVARKLRIDLPAKIPARVAAVVISEALRDVLHNPLPEPPSEEQEDYLRDLARSVKTRVPATIPTRAQMDAWIGVMLARRAETALRRLKLSPGDIVAPRDGSEAEADEVVSMDATGRVYFRGGQGAGARPHHLRVVARAGDGSPEAVRAKEEAANRRALRARHSGPPTQQRLLPLAEYEVDGVQPAGGLEELEDVLARAQDERLLQALLTRTPQLLARLTISSFGTFVVPLPRLGNAYVPDFMLVVADSGGIHYTLVELESPRQRMSLQNGQLSAKAREAVQQIEHWREWLKDNLATAQRPRSENGLGLPEIRPESPGLVLIGRRSDIAQHESRPVRQRLRERSGISIHTYDWLVDGHRPDVDRPIRIIDVSPDWEPPNPFEMSNEDIQW